MRSFGMVDRNKINESRDSQTVNESSIIASDVSFAQNRNNLSPDIG